MRPDDPRTTEQHFHLRVTEAGERLSRTGALSEPATRLRYVSGKRFQALEHLGMHRVRDVLLHTPHRYLDFSRVLEIGMADVGTDATIIARVDKVKVKRPKPRLQIVEVSVVDATGVLIATYFRQPWIAEQIREGDVVALSGKVAFSYGFKQMNSPFFEVLESAAAAGEGESAPVASAGAGSHARILPVHPSGEGVSPAWMRRIIATAVADAADVCDYLPAHLVSRYRLMSLGRALRQIHYPDSLASAEKARRRLAFDELFCLQTALQVRQRMALEGVEPTQHVVGGPHVRALKDALPFELTDEQQAAVHDILADMASPRVMNRLLLGDVGTGKTAVAAPAMASVADTGTQAAVMAPTSVLATQYAEKVGPLLDAAGVRWALVLGSTPAEERREAARGIAAGDISVVFGTTAILSDDIEFKKLSLVIVDEQHRFGVDQRAALRRKGAGADMLTMTATPIPRTLALTLYGDLSVSRITRRPVVGAGISTQVIPPENLDLAYGAIRDAVEAGQQAYVVCPLIDEADTQATDMVERMELGLEDEEGTSGAKSMHSATRMASELSNRVFKGMRVGLLTGRMTPQDKDDVMAAFRARELDILVSTTVIEVGVDVPNATVMLVFDSERFGLATLHQLRGRVGRGSIPGSVYLQTAAKRETPARARLNALERTSDGMELAELDLKLRHEGEVLGYRQSGGVSLHLVDLAQDTDLVEAAHTEALRMSETDPELTDPIHRALAVEIEDRYSAYFEEAERA